MSSAYELLREQNIARNQQVMLDLKLVGPDSLKSKMQAQKQQEQLKRQREKAKRKANLQQPARRSARAQNLPAPAYTEEVVAEDKGLEKQKDAEKMEKAKGWRMRNGKWRGETYGDVKGVECGAVFGRGDFQREGRRELSDTGFFRPFVTPEFVASDKSGCYSLILNNDNGSSEDNGDRFTYAGSGGRHRGQNRMVRASFSSLLLLPLTHFVGASVVQPNLGQCHERNASTEFSSWQQEACASH
jgi:hypothetical protein